LQNWLKNRLSSRHHPWTVKNHLNDVKGALRNGVNQGNPIDVLKASKEVKDLAKEIKFRTLAKNVGWTRGVFFGEVVGTEIFP
jgi:hypothetical protein